MQKFLVIFEKFSFGDVIDLFFITLLVYYVYRGLSKTRVLPVIQAFLVIMFLTLLSALFQLKTVNYVLEYIVSLMLIAALILFPAEIKKGLYRLGGTEFFSRLLQVENVTLKNLLEAITHLKKLKVGALIVLQKKDNLHSLTESGVELNAVVDPNLIFSLFNKHSLLHDGAMVISGNRIIAAACYIPNLTSMEVGSSKMGSRHRAALGLSEQSDAYVIVVSEESGQISIMADGKIDSNISLDKLKQSMTNNFIIKK